MVTVQIEEPRSCSWFAPATRPRKEATPPRARGAALRREAAHALREKGYPLEAAAAVIGVSYQRVQQLAS